MLGRNRLIKWPVDRFALIMLVSIGIGRQSWSDSNIPREKLPVGWKAEADLTSVFFLNQNLGWAVGGQGVVLRTVNGGKDWTEISQLNQPVGRELSLDQKYRNLRSGAKSQWTGVADGRSANQGPLRCRFESVHFINESVGWIAGGYDVPYVDRSRGVIMTTRDGGLTWQVIEGLLVPRIKRIHFSDESSGWAIGEIGNLFRTGIYFSSNGGQTWSSASADKLTDWLDGEQTVQGFVTIDQAGNPGVVKDHRYEASVMLGDPTFRLDRVRMQDGQRGWAVGKNGVIMRTENGGLSWSEATATDDKPLLKNFDFCSLSLTQNKIWVAGNPGSIVFSLDLKTGKLESHPTGIPLPLADIHFVDDQTGWAVGALGTIASTIDGGQSWQVQRGNHRSLALLGVVFDTHDLPLELLATFAGEENRVCGIVVFDEGLSDPAIQSVERVGGSSCLEGDSREDAPEIQFEKLVRTLRTLRPNVVVCNSRPTAKSSRFDPESLIAQAIRAAADPTIFRHQLQDAGLATWQVDRLAVLDFAGSFTIDPSRMLPRTGSLVEDRIALSRALIGLPLSSPDSKTYRVQQFTVASQTRESDLFYGLGQLGRPIPTLEASEGFRGNLNAIQLTNTKQEKLAQFVSYSLDSAQDFRVWHQQVLAWMLTLEEDVAGVWLVQLAERYLESGKTELAAKTLEILSTRASDHAFSACALTWLAQHYASDEMGQIAYQQARASAEVAATRASKNPFETRPTEIQVNGTTQLIWSPINEQNGTWNQGDGARQTGLEQVKPGGVGLAGYEETELTAAEQVAQEKKQADEFFEARWRLASQFLSRLGQRDPDLVVGSQYRLIEAQINRKLNGTLAIERLLKQLVQTGDSDTPGISLAAQRELVMGDVLPKTTNPLNAMICQRAARRPRLDGRLDDEVWKSAIQNGFVQALRRAGEDADQNRPDSVAFSFDDEFLYVGIRCFKLGGQYYLDSAEPRPRDAELSRRDRVEISIDVDRDYRSYQHFVIDNRGWVSERCGAATGWNPEWFVSQSSDAETWTVELAIPLSQLVASGIAEDTTWAVRLARRTYEADNLWNLDRSDVTESLRGIQLGFFSQPAQYELLQFK